MTPERYRRIDELYHAVMELEPEARMDFLAGACGNDYELRREVESLLLARAKRCGLCCGADGSTSAKRRPSPNRSPAR